MVSSCLTHSCSLSLKFYIILCSISLSITAIFTNEQFKYTQRNKWQILRSGSLGSHIIYPQSDRWRFGEHATYHLHRAATVWAVAPSHWNHMHRISILRLWSSGRRKSLSNVTYRSEFIVTVVCHFKKKL